MLDGFVITGGNANWGGDQPRGLQGGGMYNTGYNYNNIRLINCSFVNNSANYDGAGIYNSNVSLLLINCLFQNNSAGGYGGGIYYDFAGNSIINCSFVNNSANGGGGAVATFYSDPTLTNCVLFGNGGSNTIKKDGLSGPMVSYCLLEPEVTNFYSKGNNRTTSTSPFISATDPRLNACAPAIDAGSPDAYSAANGPGTDLGGNNRQVRQIDMGAYEFQGLPAQPLAIIQQPVSGSAVCAGSSVTVPVSVSGSNPNYQWYKDGQMVSGQASATLTLTNAQPTQSGSYSLVATGACNSVTSTAFSLTVNALPTVSITPSATAVCAGQSATFTATPGLDSYRWSTPDGGALLTTASISVSVAGTYSLTVTNSSGCSATADASLTVNALPSLATVTQLAPVCPGQPAPSA